MATTKQCEHTGCTRSQVNTVEMKAPGQKNTTLHYFCFEHSKEEVQVLEMQGYETVEVFNPEGGRMMIVRDP